MSGKRPGRAGPSHRYFRANAMGASHGNKQKYQSRNPLQRALIRRFQAQATELVARVGPDSVLDVGCGEGFMLAALRRGGVAAKMTGIDLSADAVSDARAQLGDAVVLEVADARDLANTDRRFDLVLMTEVLEHIPGPEAMLPILESLTHRHLVLSVPWEPFFRGLNLLRGKHVRAWGNDPEHVNHWGRTGFIRFVQSRFDVLAAPMVFPWTLVLAERRGPA